MTETSVGTGNLCNYLLDGKSNMETLAYLHLSEEYENSETKELNLKELKTTAMVAVIGVASVAAGVIATAESASARGTGIGKRYYPRYYSYRPCYQHYYPRYYSYRPCHSCYYYY